MYTSDRIFLQKVHYWQLHLSLVAQEVETKKILLLINLYVNTVFHTADTVAGINDDNHFRGVSL